MGSTVTTVLPYARVALSERVSAPGVGRLAGARADASRLRAVLDGSRTLSLAGGATLTPSVELGLRHDGGDAETGTGMELGAGLGFADPSCGLSASLAPSWGVDPGGSERLWTLPVASGLAANEDAPRSSRLDGELGYGLPAFGGSFTGTPNVGFGLSDTAREVRMGWRLTPADRRDFGLNLDLTRRETANDAGTLVEHGMMLNGAIRW